MKKKKVIAFGVFDHLHPGHKYFLKQAKKLGDYLTVVVARDHTVIRMKRLTPSYSEKERMKKVKGLEVADQVIIGRHDFKKKYDIILKLRPDVIALGYDQEFFVKNLPLVIIKMGKPCKIVRLKPFKPKLYKSSIYRKKKK